MNKRKINILTLVIFVIAAIIVITVAALAFQHRNSEKKLSEQEKIKIATSLLGQSVDEDGVVGVDSETYAFFNDADLFGYHGVVEAEYEDNLVSVTYWTSDEDYKEPKEIRTLLRDLKEIYGQYDSKNNEFGVLTDAYMWTNNTEDCSLVALGLNEDGVISICWADEPEKDMNDTADAKRSSSSTKRSSSTGSSSGSVSSSSSSGSSGSTPHICAVSGCYETGIYHIIGISGEKEYYCADHYAELNAMEDSIINSVGTTHTCAVSGCNEAGTRSIIGISGQREYYCETHYKEMQSMVNDMLGD